MYKFKKLLFNDKAALSAIKSGSYACVISISISVNSENNSDRNPIQINAFLEINEEGKIIATLYWSVRFNDNSKKKEYKVTEENYEKAKLWLQEEFNKLIIKEFMKEDIGESME